MPFSFPASEEKANYVQRQFERLASRYDLSNDIISLGMHRLWKSKAIDYLQCKADGHYLDICCGTGDLALAIAKRLNSLGTVTAVDFSRNMLKVAQSRELQKHFKAKIKWVQGDAQALPFSDKLFDGALISFGLRNLVDYQQGISEMARVVKPGGKIVNLDLGHPTMPLFTPLFHFYFRKIVPLIGRIIQQDEAAYTYLPESVNFYPKPDGISKIFERAGLSNICYCKLAGGSVALHCGTVE